MSTIETILARALNDTEFAKLLSTNPEKALTEYNLTAEKFKRFKGIARASFEALIGEERGSLIVIHGVIDPHERLSASDVPEDVTSRFSQTRSY